MGMLMASCTHGTFRLAFACTESISKASRLLRISAALVTNSAEIVDDQLRCGSAGVCNFPAARPRSSNKSILDELMHIFRSRGIQPAFLGLRPSGDFVEGPQALPHSISVKSLLPAEPLHRSDPRQFRGKQPAIERNERWRRRSAQPARFHNALPTASRFASGFQVAISGKTTQAIYLLGFCHCRPALRMVRT